MTCPPLADEISIAFKLGKIILNKVAKFTPYFYRWEGHVEFD